MLRLKLPFVDTIHPQSNKFVTDVKIKTTGESKLNESPEHVGCFSSYIIEYLSFVAVASLHKTEFRLTPCLIVYFIG